MGQYDKCSREELIRRIEELEGCQNGNSESANFKERYAHEILDSLPDMLTVLTRDGVLVELVSSEQTNHVGVPSRDFVGRNICELLSREAYRNVHNNLENVFATNCGASSHHDIVLEGKTRNYENWIMPLDDDHALCVCRDITEERAAKRELEMVKYALNNVDEEIYACRLDGTMEYANELFRLRHEIQGDITQHKAYEFWSFNSSREHWDIHRDKIRAENGSHKYTSWCKDADGRVQVWDVMSYLIYDQSAHRELVWFFSRDVTQRLEQENKVREMNSILESILNSVPVYLFVKDPGNEFRYLYWNRAFEDFSNIPASKALGHTDMEIFPNPRDAERFRSDDLEMLRTGKSLSVVEEYVTMTGETRMVNTSKSLVSMENRLPLIIGVSWDITEQKNTEMEIIRARIHAEESDRLKSAFLANMSHEIRTPLNAIVGFSRLIGVAETDEDKAQYSEIIDTNSELLLQLINDILDLSKIEAGTLEFNHKEMDLNELCRSELEILKTRTQPGVSLLFDQQYPEAKIVCDQNRLAQVITNLINNAIKFTQTGEIRFGFDLCEGRVEFYVRDTGPGIPKEKFHDIFDRFIKLNDFASGTGLGLAISKMIVENMNGTIEVDSEEGRGACFRFSIPMIWHGEDDAAALAIGDGCAKGAWLLLIAEASDMNFKLAEALLNHRFRLIRARTGQQAVELFEQMRPDAVLMDVRLPVMDGLEATRQIRALAPAVPIIAMSAYAFNSEIEAAQKAGCSDFLSKPLSRYALNKSLNTSLFNLRKE